MIGEGAEKVEPRPHIGFVPPTGIQGLPRPVPGARVGQLKAELAAPVYQRSQGFPRFLGSGLAVLDSFDHAHGHSFRESGNFGQAKDRPVIPSSISSNDDATVIFMHKPRIP
jgi:hypothetical protein